MQAATLVERGGTCIDYAPGQSWYFPFVKAIPTPNPNPKPNPNPNPNLPLPLPLPHP